MRVGKFLRRGGGGRYGGFASLGLEVLPHALVAAAWDVCEPEGVPRPGDQPHHHYNWEGRGRANGLSIHKPSSLNFSSRLKNVKSLLKQIRSAIAPSFLRYDLRGKPCFPLLITDRVTSGSRLHLLRSRKLIAQNRALPQPRIPPLRHRLKPPDSRGTATRQGHLQSSLRIKKLIQLVPRFECPAFSVTSEGMLLALGLPPPACRQKYCRTSLRVRSMLWWRS
jgi:hypothetical protein